MTTRTWLITTCCWLFVACGEEASLPEQPQLKVDRDSIGFSQEFGNGTYIGTQPQESLILENGGLQNLRITGVGLSGDKAFSLDGPLKTELRGKERTFVRIIFAPQEAKTYRATITIDSNAENTPTKTVELSGVGIQPPTDGG